jgi:hypothetical protein
VVIDAGDHLALPSVGQRKSSDEVHLPQVHRRLTLPPTVLARMLLFLGVDQAVAGQHPVDGGPGMPATQRADLGFNLGRQARGAVPRPPGAIQEARHALLLEPPSPAVQSLTRGALPGCDLTDWRPAEHLADSPVAVLGQLLYIHDHRAKHPGLSGGTGVAGRSAERVNHVQSTNGQVKHLLRPHTDRKADMSRSAPRSQRLHYAREGPHPPRFYRLLHAQVPGSERVMIICLQDVRPMSEILRHSDLAESYRFIAEL